MKYKVGDVFYSLPDKERWFEITGSSQTLPGYAVAFSDSVTSAVLVSEKAIHNGIASGCWSKEGASLFKIGNVFVGASWPGGQFILTGKGALPDVWETRWLDGSKSLVVEGDLVSSLANGRLTWFETEADWNIGRVGQVAVETNQEPLKEKACTCDSFALFNFGCKCGYLKTPYKAEY